MAIASHMMVVKEYGGVTAVLVGGTRKAMTVALSFLLFPKVGIGGYRSFHVHVRCREKRWYTGVGHR